MPSAPDEDPRAEPTYPFAPEGGVERYWLLITHQGTSRAHPLPGPGGRVTIGRLDDNDVVIADPAISRAHAEIEVGPPVRVRDLGSHNGVRLRQARLEPHAWADIAPGEAMELGPAVLVLQYGVLPDDAAARPDDTRPDAREPAAGASSARAANAPPLPPGVVVREPAMRRLYELATAVAAGAINVLVLGETGSGKELIAETIHQRSARVGGPFLRLNCAALSPTLLESELFGHEKGAFTGATAVKPGLLETAQGGTVFLDEIGEMPLALQAKLLRVIEERQVTRVGGLAPRRIDVRFVAATHRDLPAEIARGAFRQDLYFRLNGVALTVPPLRERPGEIEPLARAFIAQATPQGRTPPELSRDALARLREYGWPGNIRELRNAIERAVLLCGGARIAPEHLPPEIAQPRASGAPGGTRDLRSEMEALEKQRIVDALAKCHGNQSAAARMLGMPRRTFLARLEAYDLPRPRKGPHSS